MTINDFLRANVRMLADHGIATARLDCLILLEDVLHTDRTHLIAYLDTPLTPAQNNKLTKLVQRRASHEPLAYILGRAEFYGRTFSVDKHVLVPRPESEAMIDIVKNLLSHTIHNPEQSPWSIIDIGCGSGALAITSKLEIPEAIVIGLDIDAACLEVATRNAKVLGADVHFLQSDLLTPLSSPIGAGNDTTFGFPRSALLCNLPYVPNAFPINKAATHEPHLALFGGPDGLDSYRRLFRQLQSLQAKPAYVLTESLPEQHSRLAQIAHGSGFSLERTTDFIQLFAQH